MCPLTEAVDQIGQARLLRPACPQRQHVDPVADQRLLIQQRLSGRRHADHDLTLPLSRPISALNAASSATNRVQPWAALARLIDCSRFGSIKAVSVAPWKLPTDDCGRSCGNCRIGSAPLNCAIQ